MARKDKRARHNAEKTAKKALTWQVIGTAVAIVGLIAGVVVAVIQLRQDKEGDGDVALNACSVKDSTITAGGDVTFDCSAPLPRSLASSEAELGSVLEMFYAADPAKLPKPATYQGYEPSPYCHWWGDWATTVDELYLIDPRIDVSVAAGEGELVVLKGVEFQIFDKKPMGNPQPSAIIDCQVGGGGNPGHFIDVDTVKSTVVMRSDPDGTFSYDAVAPMPPASITAGDVERDSAIVSVVSEPGNFYLGMVRISFEINGDDKMLTIGSKALPLKWISSGGNPLVAANGRWRWDPDSASWSS